MHLILISKVNTLLLKLLDIVLSALWVMCPGCTYNLIILPDRGLETPTITTGTTKAILGEFFF